MTRNCSGVTACMRIRLEWNVNSTPLTRLRIFGISDSTVTFELGTMTPTRFTDICTNPILSTYTTSL
jgi:hypothetical protein